METDDKTYTKHSDQDDGKQNPAAVAWTWLQQLLLPVVLVAREDKDSEREDMEEQHQREDIKQSLAALQAVLIDTGEQLVRAE